MATSESNEVRSARKGGRAKRRPTVLRERSAPDERQFIALLGREPSDEEIEAFVEAINEGMPEAN